MSQLIYLTTALRPKQWVKNFFVLAALIFAGRLFVPGDILKVIGAFTVFCALSSAVYLINDWQDLARDRAHPIKKHRPLAAGLISVRLTVASAALLLFAGLITSFWLNLNLGLVAFLYVLLNFAYSFFLKNIPILDIILVAAGFVLRAIAGAEVILVAISPWLIVVSFFVAFFLVLGKRRAEVVNYNNRQLYTREFLDQGLTITTAITILAYVLYTIDTQTVAKFGTTNLLYTTPFVVYGIFRYFYLVSKYQKGGSPTETLLTDLPILLSTALWGISVGVIIYL